MLRPKRNTLVVTFHTTAEAMAMEVLCREHAIAGRLFPVPRALSSDCGIAWSMDPADRPQLEALLQKGETAYDEICELLL